MVYHVRALATLAGLLRPCSPLARHHPPALYAPHGSSLRSTAYGRCPLLAHCPSLARPLSAPSRIADGSQGKRGCHRAYGSDTSTFLCPDCPSSCRSPLPISTHSSKPQGAACRRVCSHGSTDAASVLAQPLSTPRGSHIQHSYPLLARPLSAACSSIVRCLFAPWLLPTANRSRSSAYGSRVFCPASKRFLHGVKKRACRCVRRALCNRAMRWGLYIT